MTATTDHTSEVTGESIANNLSFGRDEIADTAAKVDEQQVAELARHLCRHTRVFVAGAGRSGLVLRMFAMRLMHFGLTVHVAGDTTTPAISSGDLLLVASGSGTTSGVVKSAETAAKAGARIAAFTTNPDSPLARLADATRAVIASVVRSRAWGLTAGAAIMPHSSLHGLAATLLNVSMALAITHVWPAAVVMIVGHAHSTAPTKSSMKLPDTGGATLSSGPPLEAGSASDRSPTKLTKRVLHVRHAGKALL